MEEELFGDDYSRGGLFAGEEEAMSSRVISEETAAAAPSATGDGEEQEQEQEHSPTRSGRGGRGRMGAHNEWKRIGGSLGEKEAKVHVALWGKRLVDARGGSLVNVKEKSIAIDSTGVEFRLFTIAAALTEANGLRAHKQFGPDDETYERWPEMRALVPRCFCVVFPSTGPIDASSVISAMKGMPK